MIFDLPDVPRDGKIHTLAASHAKGFFWMPVVDCDGEPESSCNPGPIQPSVIFCPDCCGDGIVGEGFNPGKKCDTCGGSGEPPKSSGEIAVEIAELVTGMNGLPWNELAERKKKDLVLEYIVAKTREGGK